MLDKFLNKLPLNNSDDYIDFNSIKEDEEMRIIMKEQMKRINEKLNLEEDMHLEVKNIDDLNIINIERNEILLNLKNEIEFSVPLRVYKNLFFYDSFTKKRDFFKQVDTYLTYLDNLLLRNKTRVLLKEFMDRLNKEDNTLEFVLVKEDDKDMFIQLVTQNKEVLTNMKLNLDNALSYITKDESLRNTKDSYLKKLKEKIVEKHFQPINLEFDIDRVQFNEEFKYELGGVINILPDESNVKDIENLLKIENYLITKYPMICDYLKTVTCIPNEKGFDTEKGTLGSLSTEEDAKELAVYLMELLKKYHFVLYHNSLNDIPFEPLKVEWCEFEYTISEENKEIRLSMSNLPSYTFSYNDIGERI